MAERKVYDVSPKGNKWSVKQHGADRAIGYYDKKSDAVDRARDVAKEQRPSQVVVHRQDGTIENEYTYGDDPFPPRG